MNECRLRMRYCQCGPWFEGECPYRIPAERQTPERKEVTQAANDGTTVAQEFDADAPALDHGGTPPPPVEPPTKDEGGDGDGFPEDPHVQLLYFAPIDPARGGLKCMLGIAPELTPAGAAAKLHPAVHFGYWLHRNHENLMAMWEPEYQLYRTLRMQKARRDPGAPTLVGLDGKTPL